MNKRYISPAQRVYSLNEESPLLATSIEVSNEKVNDESSIGFVKEKSTENYDVWNEDWSK